MDITILHLAGWRDDGPLRTVIVEDELGGLPVLRATYRRAYAGPFAWPLITAVLAGARDAARRRPIDLVHAHVYTAAFPTAIAAARLRVPLVVTEHSTVFLDNDPGILSRRWDLMARLAFNRASVVAAVSPALEAAIHHVAPSARTAVIPNAVRSDMFHPRSAAPPLGRDRIRLVTTCLLVAQKRVDLLITAVAALAARGHDVELDIVGDGPLRRDLEAQARRDGVVVRFHGLLPKPAVADRLRRADAFVIASDFETFCVAAVEALACGTPVVATRCGGPEQFVTPEVGRLVPRGDATALATAIEELHAEGLARGGFARADIARSVEGFRPAAVRRAIMSAYGTALSPRR
ncbi:MAG TPA: glycosyltransferase [Acidimicrobiales bacterium]|nr:glycosyltransferase [Acidimicrobiales bacterium]